MTTQATKKNLNKSINFVNRIQNKPKKKNCQIYLRLFLSNNRTTEQQQQNPSMDCIIIIKILKMKKEKLVH